MGVVVELTLDVEPLLELLTDLRLVDVCNKVVYPIFDGAVHLGVPCVGLLKGGRRVTGRSHRIHRIEFTATASVQHAPHPSGAHNKRRCDCGVYLGVLSEAGINNQCDTIAEKMSLVDVLREVVGIRTASTSTLYECRHCGTTLPADTEMCPTCGGEDVACYQF